MTLLRWFGRKTFAHGIHPKTNKESTADKPIRRLPFAPRLSVPLAQHLGKPSRAIVKIGEEVVRGQPIAVADGFMSVPQHAPATGRIEAIALMPSAQGPRVLSIIIKVHEASSQEVLWRNNPRDMATLGNEEIIQAVQDTGMVGLGGAAFPSHVKLKVPAGATIDTLIVNGCECEPYLTTDHRVMLEHSKELIRGTQYAMRVVGAKQAIIGVEDNKPDAIAAITQHLPAGDAIKVEAVETKYPQGAEKMLITALLGREVPSGGLPAHIGVVVNNVGTLAALGNLLPRGEGLIERVVTVTGPGVKKPGNYLVPVGTPLRFLLEHVGFCGSEQQVILGGPMMGHAVASLDVPITKGSSGVLVLSNSEIKAKSRRVHPCIRCGKCVTACPMQLNPSQLGMLAAKREYEVMDERFHLKDCIECGCCSFICPSAIPLVQYFRIAKSILRERAA
ncbi:MAG: electron transport complex subunit RsxC [Thiohalomonadaceae bacterium]